jgi:predicted outer membrane protein
MRLIFSFFSVSLVVLLSTLAVSMENGTTQRSDGEFLFLAYGQLLWEAEAAAIASGHSASQAVKEFGAHMTWRYNQALDRLRVYASKHGIDLPSKIALLHVNTLEHLRQQQGAALDRIYMNLVVNELRQDLALLRRQADAVEDGEVAEMAQDLLLLFQRDEEIAETILGNLPYSGYRAPSGS